MKFTKDDFIFLEDHFAEEVARIANEKLSKHLIEISYEKILTFEEEQRRIAYKATEEYEKLDKKLLKHTLLQAIGSELFITQVGASLPGIRGKVIRMSLCILKPDGEDL